MAKKNKVIVVTAAAVWALLPEKMNGRKFGSGKKSTRARFEAGLWKSDLSSIFIKAASV